MSFNIDDIKLEKKKFSILGEIKDFIVIFTVIVWFWWLFLNAQLVVIAFDNIFNNKSVSANDLKIAVPKKKVNLTEVYSSRNSWNWDDMSELKNKILQNKLSEKLSKLKLNHKTDMIYKPSYESLIKNNLQSYNINFNTLPPDGRLIIPKIWVDVHIVTLTNVPIEVIEKADYDEYLYDWVVQYPYTPEPWSTWNVFLFWHTSYYWWKKNPYGTVFSNIPRLKSWDSISLIYNWKKHTYKVFKKMVVYPNYVDDIYKKYQDGEYVTLMWCYPIGSDAQRMLIIAKKDK